MDSGSSLPDIARHCHTSQLLHTTSLCNVSGPEGREGQAINSILDIEHGGGTGGLSDGEAAIHDHSDGSVAGCSV